MPEDELGPVRAEFQDVHSGAAFIVSYHYDIHMRMRKIKVRDNSGDFWLEPVVLGDGSAKLERREIE